MNVMNRFMTLALLVPFLIGASEVSAQTSRTNDTNGYVFGNYFISAWETGWDYSKGSFTRTWDGNTGNDELWYLWMNLDHARTNNYVGFDAGVGRNIASGTQVSDLSSYNDSYKSPKIGRGVYYRFTDNLSPLGDAYWWMGPKTIISESPYYQGLDYQYECYVVDNANISPQQLVNRLGLQYVSEGNYNGSVYKHYRVNLGLIRQVWSIRQNYRSEGWSSANWIQRQWYLDGLVPWNYYNLGWKINVETAGAYGQGSNCGFSYLSLPWN